MTQCQVIVLAHEREEHGRDISFKGKSRNDSLMKWFIGGQEHSDRYLEPRAFRTLTRVIQSGKFRCLQHALEARLGDRLDESYALDSSSVFTRQAVQRALNEFDRSPGQFSFVLVLDFDSHETIKTPSTLKSISGLRCLSKDFVL